MERPSGKNFEYIILHSRLRSLPRPEPRIAACWSARGPCDLAGQCRWGLKSSLDLTPRALNPTDQDAPERSRRTHPLVSTPVVALERTSLEGRPVFRLRASIDVCRFLVSFRRAWSLARADT